MVELEKVFVALPAPSMVISKKSSADVGLETMEPCTLKLPVKSLVYTAIVCSALLLLMPGLASIVLETLSKDFASAVAVNPVIDVLATKSGYAPSKSSIVPAAAYPVSEYVTSLLPSDQAPKWSVLPFNH